VVRGMPARASDTSASGERHARPGVGHDRLG
jgi:hypothetical protein